MIATTAVKTMVRGGCIGLLGLVLGGCVASISSVAHDAYASNYQCPTADVTETDKPDTLKVTGCGHEEEFTCAAGWYGTKYEAGSATTCSYRQRLAFQATDGSIYVDNWDSVSPAREAAVASAAHDLPCPATSIAPVDDTTLEGCGQRVTYRQIDQPVATPPIGQHKITGGSRFMLVGRVPIATPSAPAAQ